MQRSNVTVSLPEDILREVRHLAVDQGVSLSRFLAMVLEERVEAAQRYRDARRRHVKLLEKGLPLGTNGRIGWSREELHEH